MSGHRAVDRPAGRGQVQSGSLFSQTSGLNAPRAMCRETQSPSVTDDDRERPVWDATHPIADPVMRLPTGELQRKVDDEDEEELLQTKPADRPGRTDAGPGDTAPDSVHRVLRSPGRPLDTAARSFFEPRFGHDFSAVRVHVGADATASVRAVNARAFTVGSDLVFGPGEYAPDTARGRHLMAHELTHVLQQGGGGPRGSAPGDAPSLQPKLTINEPGDRYEQEADRVADEVLRLSETDLPITGVTTRRAQPALRRKAAARDAGLPPRVTGRATPQLMRLSPDRFRRRLGHTREQRVVVDALFAHPKFLVLWNWLDKCKCDRADLGPIRLRVRRTFGDGVQTFGGLDQGRGTLTINPKIRKARENPQELVDTLVHEVVHAISWAWRNGLCPGPRPPLAELDIMGMPSSGERTARERRQAGKPACQRTRFPVAEPPKSLTLENVEGGLSELEQFERSGPGASDPCRTFLDIREAPQQRIVEIVDDIRRETGVGGPTRTQANVILREDLRQARERASGYGEVLEQAPLLRSFITCRQQECARPQRQRDLDRCFSEVLDAAGPDANGTPVGAAVSAAPDAPATTGALQRAADSDRRHAMAGPAVAPPLVDAVLRSPGEPLPAATRAYFEPRFGHDFGAVRIHRDALAAESARAVAARAYTVGRHVTFAPDRYAPHTAVGRRLLAHELTHVVQQREGTPRVQREGEDDKKEESAPAKLDVAIVLTDNEQDFVEGRTYAKKVLRVTSVEDAAKQLQGLKASIGTLYVVSHSNRVGEVQFISGIGTISWVPIRDLGNALKGAVTVETVDFRGCKLGAAVGAMESFRKTVGAQATRGNNCWSFVSRVTPLVYKDEEITQPSQIPKGMEGAFNRALIRQINGLKTDDGKPVKDCLLGLGPGDRAGSGTLKKIWAQYWANQGHLVASWASPDFNKDWQKGSICVNKMTTSTKPCAVVETKAPAGAAKQNQAPAGESVAPGAVVEEFSPDPAATETEEPL